MEFKKNRLEKVVEEIKLAYLSHVPIVQIVTDEIELLQDILKHPELTILPETDEDKNREMLCTERDKVKNSNYFFSQHKFSHVGKSLEGILSTRPCLNVWVAWSQLGNNSGSNLGNNSGSNLGNHSGSKSNNYSTMVTDLLSHVRLFFDIQVNRVNNERAKVENARKSLSIIISSDSRVPEELAPYTEIIYMPQLSDNEIRDLIRKVFKDNGLDLKESWCEVIDQMIVNLRGMTQCKIEQILSKLIVSEVIIESGAELDRRQIFHIINLGKKQMLEKCPGLSWVNYDDTCKVEGLQSIKEWIEDRKTIFSDIEKAKRRYLDIPKGILISGIPGSGKSLMAKYTAKLLNLPLISLNMGGLLGGIVGDSEHNMEEALRIAEKMAPCVLWIDEIEKAFSGINSGKSDGGVAQRMFGKFLIWMQEKHAACFVFATSNDMTDLPPELFRSERFDRKFFTFMPTAVECAAIFAGNIKAQNKAYRRPENMKKGVKCILFDEELEKEQFWLDAIINKVCVANGCELERGEKNKLQWKGDHKPINKLLTGADISAIIKEAKFLVYKNVYKLGNEAANNTVYDAKAMEAAVKFVLETFQPYGETNLFNIVKCFIKLHVNQFQSASGKCILNFEKYDEDKYVYRDMAEVQNYPNKYDRVLFNTLVGAINKYAEK